MNAEPSSPSSAPEGSAAGRAVKCFAQLFLSVVFSPVFAFIAYLGAIFVTLILKGPVSKLASEDADWDVPLLINTISLGIIMTLTLWVGLRRVRWGRAVRVVLLVLAFATAMVMVALDVTTFDKPYGLFVVFGLECAACSFMFFVHLTWYQPSWVKGREWEERRAAQRRAAQARMASRA